MVFAFAIAQLSCQTSGLSHLSKSTLPFSGVDLRFGQMRSTSLCFFVRRQPVAPQILLKNDI